MEAGNTFLGLADSTLAVVIILMLFALWSAHTWYYGGVTVPLPSYKTGFVGSIEGFAEGDRFRFLNKQLVNPVITDPFFGGVARGSGIPDCLRSSSEGAALIALFTNVEPAFDEGPDTLRELKILIGKLCCFKKDLVSPSYTVNATRNQKYVANHDIEPIGETTGRCFSKTMSPRDLNLSFDKWSTRGETLIKKLCTTYRLAPADVKQAEHLFRFLLRDVRDIARGACLDGKPQIAGKPGPRDAHPYDPPMDLSVGEYKGYY